MWQVEYLKSNDNYRVVRDGSYFYWVLHKLDDYKKIILLVYWSSLIKSIYLFIWAIALSEFKNNSSNLKGEDNYDTKHNLYNKQFHRKTKRSSYPYAYQQIICVYRIGIDFLDIS